MGKALAGLKRRPEAMEKFRRAIQLSPDYWDAHFKLGGELAFDEKAAEARAAECPRAQFGYSPAIRGPISTSA